MSKYLKWYPYTNGRQTQGLFLELRNADTEYSVDALYTLDHEDFTDPHSGKVYLSLRKRYLELKDPSESAIAEIYFFDHRHWDNVCNSPFLEPYIAEWRVSLERILQEDAIERIRKIADSGNFAAAKWLAEKTWKASLEGRDSLGRKVKKDKTLPNIERAETSEDAKRVLAFIKPRGVK